MPESRDWAINWESDLPVAVATEKIEKEAAAHGMRVLTAHDVSATLREKGFESPEYRIVEVCNAKYAHQAIAVDPMVGLWMPCPIAIYEQNGKTKVTTVKTTLLADFFPNVEIAPLAAEIQGLIVEIIEAALKTT